MQSLPILSIPKKKEKAGTERGRETVKQKQNQKERRRNRNVRENSNYPCRKTSR